MSDAPGYGDPMAPLKRLTRRRKFIVYKQLQYQLLRGTLLHLALILVIAVAILYCPLIIQVAMNEPGSEAAIQASGHLEYLQGKFWPTFLLVCVFISLDALRTSHRLAGPILRFRDALEQLRDGVVPKQIVLRKGDFLTDDCDRLNEAIREAEIRMNEHREAAAQLALSAERVRALFESTRTGSENERSQALEDLLARVQGSERDEGFENAA